jgi:hypothetical protein
MANLLSFFSEGLGKTLTTTVLDVGKMFLQREFQKDLTKDNSQASSIAYYAGINAANAAQNAVNQNSQSQAAANQVLPSINESKDNVALWLIPGAILAIGILFIAVKK